MAVSRPDPIIFNDAIKTAYVENSMKIVMKQAGAELGQSQVKLEVIIYIGVKVEVDKNLKRSRDKRIGAR